MNNRLPAHVSKIDNCASTSKTCAKGLEIPENIWATRYFIKIQM